MTRISPMFVLAMLLAAATARAGSNDTDGARAVFTAKNGKVVAFEMRSGILRAPISRRTELHDCSDSFQTCLTNDRGFAFAYFRNCNDLDYKRLKFHPTIVSALHNNLWMVFDVAPNYMFHFLIPKGVIGIYVGPTSSFDFRSVLRDRHLQLDRFDALEYRITSLDAIAACRE